MKVTKYGHACLLVEVDGNNLVIDPGDYSKDLGTPQKVIAIVITHAHSDHLNEDLIQSLLDTNPEAVIYGPSEVAEKLEGRNVKVVTPGSAEQAGPFKLQFFGGKHADIYNGMPGTENVGVMVNDTLYFPGDSFDEPGVPVRVLAAPTSGPWLKTGEAMGFIASVKPKQCFPTHDAFLSQIGEQGTNSFVEKVAAPDTEYKLLASGESLEA